MSWYAKDAKKDNIKGITGQAAIDYMRRLEQISRLPKVAISVMDYGMGRGRYR